MQRASLAGHCACPVGPVSPCGQGPGWRSGRMAHWPFPPPGGSSAVRVCGAGPQGTAPTLWPGLPPRWGEGLGAAARSAFPSQDAGPWWTLRAPPGGRTEQGQHWSPRSCPALSCLLTWRGGRRVGYTLCLFRCVLPATNAHSFLRKKEEVVESVWRQKNRRK